MRRTRARDVWHIVGDDEDLTMIAAEYDIKDWRLVYDHEKNAPLKQSRPNPHILKAGDRVWIPEVPPATFTVQTDAEHQFVLYPPTGVLHLVLRGDRGPLAGVRYEIWLEDERVLPVRDDVVLLSREDGVIHHSVPLAPEFELRVWPPGGDDEDDEDDDGGTSYLSMLVRLGHLDPLDTVEGVRDRLRNLGYGGDGDPPGTAGPALESALRRFQRDLGLDATGEVDDMTRRMLLEHAGS